MSKQLKKKKITKKQPLNPVIPKNKGKAADNKYGIYVNVKDGIESDGTLYMPITRQSVNNGSEPSNKMKAEMDKYRWHSHSIRKLYKFKDEKAAKLFLKYKDDKKNVNKPKLDQSKMVNLSDPVKFGRVILGVTVPNPVPSNKKMIKVSNGKSSYYKRPYDAGHGLPYSIGGPGDVPYNLRSQNSKVNQGSIYKHFSAFEKRCDAVVKEEYKNKQSKVVFVMSIKYEYKKPEPEPKGNKLKDAKQKVVWKKGPDGRIIADEMQKIKLPNKAKPKQSKATKKKIKK